LWRWAMRRHSNKGKKWIKAKYFKRTTKSNWDFCGISPIGLAVSLTKARHVRFKKHIKVRQGVNPYDPQYVQYFERRRRNTTDVPDRKLLRKLWLEQDGLCPLCRTEITQQTGWHMHHILQRSSKGKTTQENLVLLHPMCHDHWHLRDNESNTG